ncbi:PadR family transcriptional regulator [bacterium]|nr:PadR family transcriptional regulator [bacterium]
MSKNDTVKYAILGLLNMEPMSGYDIKKHIETGIKHFWNMSYGSIYPRLNKLTQEQLVTKKIINQEGKPNRIIYSITEKGEDELYGWQTQGTEIAQKYDTLLLKIFISQNLSRDEQIALINDYREKIEEKFLFFKKSESDFLKKSYESEKRFLYYITLRSGILNYEAKLKWMDETLELLEKYDK